MAHYHHCEVCNQVVASCADEHCQGDTGHFCTAHHPDPKFQRVDPPTVRMHVKVVPDDPNIADGSNGTDGMRLS